MANCPDTETLALHLEDHILDIKLNRPESANAVNAPIQGSAADIMKIGMRNFHKTMRKDGYTSNDFRIIGQVHDEIIVEAKNDVAECAMSCLQNSMENAVKLTIKLVAEPEIATTWGEAK